VLVYREFAICSEHNRANGIDADDVTTRVQKPRARLSCRPVVHFVRIESVSLRRRSLSRRAERTENAIMASADRSVDWAMAKMTRAGAFGPDARFVSFALDGRHAERNQFATTVLYGTVTVRDGDGARAHRLVIKTKHPEPELRRMFKSDLQFGNEILFYGRMAPFLADVTPAHGRQGFCRYFYGSNCRGDLAHRDVVVLENENPRGYRSWTSTTWWWL